MPTLPCPVCRAPLLTQDAVTCPSCETAVHEGCREFIGGCARYACVEAASPRRRLIEYLKARLELRAIKFGGLALVYCFFLAAFFVAGDTASPIALAAGALLWECGRSVRASRRLTATDSLELARATYAWLLADRGAVPPRIPDFVRRLGVVGAALAALVLLTLGDIRDAGGCLGFAVALWAYFRFQARLRASAETAGRLQAMWADELALLAGDSAPPKKVATTEPSSEEDDPDYLGFLSALGRELSQSLSSVVGTDKVSHSDALEVWVRAFGRHPSPAAVARASSEELRALRDAAVAYFECADISTAHLAEALTRTAERWCSRRAEE